MTVHGRLGKLKDGTGCHTTRSQPLYGGDLFISVKAVEWVFENSESSGNARSVLLVLAAHYREGTAWLGFERISKLANVSRPTLSKVISELEDLGELQVEREEGRVNNYSFPKFEAVKTSKVLEPNQLNSPSKPVNPPLPKEVVLEKLKAEEESSSLPLCKEERRALPKPVKEPKVRKGFQKTFAKREYVPPPKPPQDWDWFAGMWHRYTEVFPVGTKNCWEELEARMKYFSKEQIENRVSRWIEQRDGRITGWTALDFLRDCALMMDKEGDDIASVVNEE